MLEQSEAFARTLRVGLGVSPSRVDAARGAGSQGVSGALESFEEAWGRAAGEMGDGQLLPVDVDF